MNGGSIMFSFGFGALLVLVILLVWSFRILREYERGVVFNLGRHWAVKGPGWFILIPVIQQMVKMDLRTVVLDVPPQDVITRDNVSVKVNAVVYFRVIDPQKAVIQVADFLTATNLLAQTTLRAVLGKHELDALLAEREQLNLDIQKTLDAQTETWGIKVSNVEIKDVDLNETMVRAIARQAEAERERRAKVIHAEGELQASEKLLQAAQMLSKQPEAMQLRYLQTLSNIAGDKTSTIVFPVPMRASFFVRRSASASTSAATRSGITMTPSASASTKSPGLTFTRAEVAPGNSTGTCHAVTFQRPIDCTGVRYRA